MNRTRLGIGAALLVGGWGAMQFAEADMRTHQLVSERPAYGYPASKAWGDVKVPIAIIHGSGVCAMAVGAGLFASGIPARANHTSRPAELE